MCRGLFSVRRRRTSVTSFWEERPAGTAAIWVHPCLEPRALQAAWAVNGE